MKYEIIVNELHEDGTKTPWTIGENDEPVLLSDGFYLISKGEDDHVSIRAKSISILTIGAAIASEPKLVLAVMHCISKEGDKNDAE